MAVAKKFSIILAVMKRFSCRYHLYAEAKIRVNVWTFVGLPLGQKISRYIEDYREVAFADVQRWRLYIHTYFVSLK